MSSIFDVPAGLLFVLSLVTTNPSNAATAATGLAPPSASKSFALNSAPCRHGRQAWYAALSQGAGGAAFSHLAARIFRTSSGRYYVPVNEDRQKILELRRDNAVSCFIALSSAASNAQIFKARTDRQAGLAELYLAHVFGIDRAIAVVSAMQRTPLRRMMETFPGLEDTYRSLYRGGLHKMTLGSFSKRLERAINRRIAEAGGKIRATNGSAKRNQARHRKSPAARIAERAVETELASYQPSPSARAINQGGLALARRALVRPNENRIPKRFYLGLGLAAKEVAEKNVHDSSAAAF